VERRQSRSSKTLNAGPRNPTVAGTLKGGPLRLQERGRASRFCRGGGGLPKWGKSERGESARKIWGAVKTGKNRTRNNHRGTGEEPLIGKDMRKRQHGGRGKRKGRLACRDDGERGAAEASKEKNLPERRLGLNNDC